MQFTGKRLQLVRNALDRALSDIANEIGTCPDVIEFAGDIELLESERVEHERLLVWVEKAIAREHQQRAERESQGLASSASSSSLA